MSSIDAFIDEHEALDLARACHDSKLYLNGEQKQVRRKNGI